MNRYILFFLLSGLLSCTGFTQINTPDLKNYTEVKKKFLTSDWFHKDISNDSLPGTSLFRTYQELIKNKQGEEVIVAFLDMSIDTDHTYLKEHIWVNTDEIKGNGIDDDGNGYIDDIHGWSFLGNQKGENLKYEQYEYVRIIKKLSNSSTPLSAADSLLLERAIRTKKQRILSTASDLENVNMVIESRTNADSFLKKKLGVENYTLKDLDSLKKEFPNDSILQLQVRRMGNFITYNFTPEVNNSRKESLLNREKFILNEEYPERGIIGDTIEDRLDIVYGNNQVNAEASFLNHGTLTSGLLNTKYLNVDSLNIFNTIKIMPLRISAFGDEHDKDIALAIRYAVDNGARVINMSFSKRFSLYKNWVDDAIKYAESKGVLIIKSAGNDRFDTDIEENTKYPNDYNNNLEFSTNVITVGGTSHRLNEKLLYSGTNYGKETVDIFAPGQYITSLAPNNEIDIANKNGTSFSTAIVSGISALLFSYYPHLDASALKKIILESGLTFEHLVNLPKQAGKERVQKPFNELSKSGKLINAYNAFLYAEKYQKN